MTKMILIEHAYDQPQVVDFDYDDICNLFGGTLTPGGLGFHHEVWTLASKYNYGDEEDHIVILYAEADRGYGYNKTATLLVRPKDQSVCMYGPILIARMKNVFPRSGQAQYLDLTDNFIDDFYRTLHIGKTRMRTGPELPFVNDRNGILEW